jgi:hypothetical protein
MKMKITIHCDEPGLPPCFTVLAAGGTEPSVELLLLQAVGNSARDLLDGDTVELTVFPLPPRGRRAT